MKSRGRFLFFLLLVLCIGTGSSLAQDGAAASPGSRAIEPNDVTFELFGRCLFYSVSYSRRVVPQLGIEGSFAFLGGTAASVLFFSADARFYFVDGNSSPFIAAGGVVCSEETDAGPFARYASSAYAFVNPGFETRSTDGFVFRLGLFFFFAEGGPFTWPGMQLGMAF